MSFTYIIKPTYSCNFQCKYCYLSNNTKKRSDTFSIDFVKQIITQIKEAHFKENRKKIAIILHGGEPLLWGKENYREALVFMQRELVDFDLHLSMQTNLSLIDEEYLDILTQYNVKLGFSLDGFKEIHDSQRVGIGNSTTFDTIMEKLALCRERGLKLGCIVVGSRKHIGRIPELYQFMKEKELNFKFNPLFISGEAKQNRDEYGITAQEYVQMCIELFDLWFDDQHGKVSESNFVEIASNIATGHTTGCMFSQNCQDNFLAIAPTGDVMPCGRFCDDGLKQYAYGNLHHETLTEILLRIKQSEAYRRAEYIANSDCAKCKWFNICHGGCLHDGFLRNGDFKSKTLLCHAYKQLFAHIKKRMKDAGMLEQFNQCIITKK